MKLHGIIAKDQALEWGVLRSGETGISGTKYKPPIPMKKTILDIFNLNFNDKYIKAAKILIRLIKAQPFWDGNKRTTSLITNKYIIENSLGIIMINGVCFDEFNILLNNYYDSDSQEDILVNFLLKKCIYNTLDKKLVR